MKTAKRNRGTISSGPTFTLQGFHKEKGAENLPEEIMAENFSNLEMEREIQIQEAHRIPRKEHKDIYTKTQYN